MAFNEPRGPFKKPTKRGRKPNPAIEATDELHCELSIAFARYGGVNSSYDAERGLSRKFVLLGRIDDPDLDWDGDETGLPDSAFHGKQVRLTVYTPLDGEFLRNVQASYMGDTGNPCGVVTVRTGVEPERFELDGEMREIEPVIAQLHLSADAFEAIRRQAAEAYDHRRIMRATITLVGGALPAKDSRVKFWFGHHLKDLDISKDQVYGIGGFEIGDTRDLDHLRGRVQINRNEPYGVSISILLTQVKYKAEVEDARIYSLSCEGRVKGRGDPYEGIDVTVEFSEHERNKRNELPERAFFGEFAYYVKQPDEEYSSNFFSLNLRYVPADIRDLLIILFSLDRGTHVILTVTLSKEEDELLATTKVLRGNVRSYEFGVYRDLITDA